MSHPFRPAVEAWDHDALAATMKVQFDAIVTPENPSA